MSELTISDVQTKWSKVREAKEEELNSKEKYLNAIREFNSFVNGAPDRILADFVREGDIL